MFYKNCDIKIELNIIFRNKTYKSRLYDVYKYIVFTFYIIHTCYSCWLIIYANEDITRTHFWLNAGYTIQFCLAIFKCFFMYVVGHFIYITIIISKPYRMKRQQKLRWLVDEERATPFLNGEEHNTVKRFKNVKKTIKNHVILAWCILALVIFTSALQTLTNNSKNDTKSKKSCLKIFEKLITIFNESQMVVPSFNNNNIYENVEIMQSYLNQSLEEKCVKAVKIFPWLISTPYNNQISPNYELTLIIQEIILISRSCSIIPFDMLFHSLLIFSKFQFETIKIDLVYKKSYGCLTQFLNYFFFYS